MSSPLTPILQVRSSSAYLHPSKGWSLGPKQVMPRKGETMGIPWMFHQISSGGSGMTIRMTRHWWVHWYPHFGRTGNPEVRGKIGVWGGSESWLLPGGWGSSTDLLIQPMNETMMRTVEPITFYKLKTKCNFVLFFLGHPQAKEWLSCARTRWLHTTYVLCFSFESQIRR